MDEKALEFHVSIYYYVQVINLEQNCFTSQKIQADILKSSVVWFLSLSRQAHILTKF